jgi:hypothetical protein
MKTDDGLTAAIQETDDEIAGLLRGIVAAAPDATRADRIFALLALTRLAGGLKSKKLKRRSLLPVEESPPLGESSTTNRPAGKPSGKTDPNSE